MSTPASTIAARSTANQSTARHELFFFNYFRLGQAAVYTALAFHPEHLNWPNLPEPLFARLFALAYLLAALVMVARTRQSLNRPVLIVSVGLSLDIAAALLALMLMHDVRMGVAMMLAVNLATGALLLPFRLSMFFAAMATLGMLGHSFFDLAEASSSDRELAEYGLFGAAYFACTSLCYVLGRNIRASEALAEQRGIDLANLSQVNELIIRRMKTGVLLVDEGNRIHQLNESAWMLMGNPSADQRDLGTLAPELSRRLYHWRTSGKLDESATMLADGTPEVIPRFSRLAPNDDSHVLIFLDDTSLVSRRAEELTLSSLGRLSASIAHEIRNPLAAIHYSAQLLAESTDMNDTDLRMVEIINNHCSRLNEIIENILQLSRRERSRPETLDLSQWVHHFVTEYRQGNDLGSDILRAGGRGGRPPTPPAGDLEPRAERPPLWSPARRAGPRDAGGTPFRGRDSDPRGDRSRPGHPAQGGRTDLRAVLHDARIRHGTGPLPGPADDRSQPGSPRIRTRGGRRQLLPDQSHATCTQYLGSPRGSPRVNSALCSRRSGGYIGNIHRSLRTQ